MKIEILDYQSWEEEEVEFGTCEMCMSTGSAMFEQVLVQHDDGDTYWVDLYAWDYGHLSQIHIDNIARFAAWLSEQDLDPAEYGHKLSYYDMEDLADEYDAAEREEASQGDQ